MGYWNQREKFVLELAQAVLCFMGVGILKHIGLAFEGIILMAGCQKFGL